MRLVLISFSAQGEKTAGKLQQGFRNVHEVNSVCARELSGSVSELVRESFARAEGILFVGAAGIAVRLIAPFVKDKRRDPAVVVVDELGTFAISLLSGHLGGANGLARQAAEILGAIPVITTATDIHGAFAVDLFAAKNRLAITSMKLAKEISAAVLEGEPIGFFTGFSVEGQIPQQLKPGIQNRRNLLISAEKAASIEEGETLWLFPKTAVLGMGCRKGTPVEELRLAAERVLSEAGITADSLLSLASIDIKREEPGLMELSRELSVPFECYSAEELLQVESEAIDFSSSEFVTQVTGVGTVCERAAVRAAKHWMERLGENDASPTLAVKKQICGRVTAAVAVIPARRVLTF